MKFVLFRTPRPATRQRLAGSADAAPAPDIMQLIVTLPLVKSSYILEIAVFSGLFRRTHVNKIQNQALESLLKGLYVTLTATTDALASVLLFAIPEDPLRRYGNGTQTNPAA